MDQSRWLERLREGWALSGRRRALDAKPQAGRRASFEALEARLALALTVNIPVASAVEGSAPVAATVTRTGTLTSALTVTLSSNDTTEATVPTSVVIPANQASASFNVTVVDDNVVDGTKTVTITAVATGHPFGVDTIDIVNNDIVALRQGTTGDVLNVRPGAQAGQFDLTNGPAAISTATPLPVVDLSVITAGDQRAALVTPTSTPYSRAQRLVKIALNQRYTLSAWALNTSEFNEAPLGFASFDVDKLEILPLHVQKYEEAVDTTLAGTLLPGDTAIFLTNASGWSNDLWESGGTRALAWYGYKDSTGQTYADFTYTRNVANDFDHGLWAAGGIHWDAEANAYRIDLLEPWSGPGLAAGAAVRNAASGETINAPTSPVAVDPLDKYTTYVATVGGGVWTGGARDESLFRPGTAYIQPALSPYSVAGEIVVGPEEDSIYGGPTDPTKLVTEGAAGAPAVFDLDVLGKGAFGSAATVVIDPGPTAAYGTATILAGAGPGGRAVIHYAAAGFSGTDAVTYTLRNTANNATFTLSVKINILGGNLTAVGTPPSFLRDATTVTVPGLAVTGILTSTSNVRLVGGPAHGTVKLNSDGSFVYTPEAGYVGLDVFHGEALTSTGPTPVTAIISVVASNDALVDARLRETGIAMLNYESANKNLPLDDLPATNFDASGNPYLSWRVHVLPYLGYQALYNQFRLNEPWNSAHNLPLASKMPEVFRTPGDAASSTTTRFQLISGEGEPYYLRRVNGRLVGPRIQFVTDGLSNTILAVESGANQAVTWTKPDDLEFVEGSPLSALGTLSGRIKAVMMDGAVRTFSSTIEPADFTALVTVTGDEVVDAATLARAYATSAGLPTFGETTTDNNLRQLALGVSNYETAKGRYPVSVITSQRDAAGNPLLSWRVHILPYVGYASLFSRFKLDEPWNSANNMPLLAEMPDIFRSTGDAATSTTTRMQTFYGAGVPFRPSVGLTHASITDGHANTIMIMEVGANVALPWTQPADVAFNPSDPRAGLGTLGGDSLRAVMFDRTLVKLPADIGAAALAALATNAGDELIDAATIELRARQQAGYNPVSGEQLNRLKNLAIGMINAQDASLFFPASSFDSDGTPLLSWRVHILPYLGYSDLYAKFRKNEPWDSTWNLSLLDEMPNLFRTEGDGWDSYLTQTELFTGPGAPFPATGTNTTRGPRSSNIIDGFSNTLGVIEAGRGNAVPWTKPTDLWFHANNPFSELVGLGPNFVSARLDGAVLVRPTSISVDELRDLITHDGAAEPDPPPPWPAPFVYAHQTAGGTRMSEFGADVFDIVLDTAPVGNVMVNLSVSNSGLAALDRPSLVFTPANWNKPQRVIVRAADDHVVNTDRTVDITVAAPGYAASQMFSAKIVNDDLPALRGDFNDDTVVDGRDFLAWQRSAGMGWNAARPQGDADADTDVDHADLTAWNVEFGGLAAGPSADFDGSGQVNAADLAAWRGGYGTAVGAATAAGDADLDHDVDGRDILLWQRTFGGGGATSSAALSAASGAGLQPKLAGGLDMLSGLPSLEASGPTEVQMSVAPESIGDVVRDGAFASLGGMAQPAGAWDSGIADARSHSAGEEQESIGELLVDAQGLSRLLGDDLSHFFSRWA